ncbi:flagellar basal-body rod protein FlgG [Polycladidibacter stylochi]|uniref:flagellar basal-body rod protein FlgG n=1 Tax=Polycladidibacter stylochi TaxID=1807766 RepID=UPI00082E0C94|nr:flagellar basal-body rod protein FlgG [Pseudovibrio stylochi]
MKALYIAATGMKAQELNVEVISNNVANMRTTGYKRQRADFQDLLYENKRRMGTETSDTGTMVPNGVQLGSGVRTVATTRIMTQGTVAQSGKSLDLAVRGEGFFQINMPDGTNAYTRDGSFARSQTGQIVTADGYTLSPGITIPQDVKDLTINKQGLVQAIDTAGQTVTLGQIQIASFINKAGLQAVGDNLFTATAASGEAQLGNPGQQSYGSILQGYLEAANVDAVTELSDLISAQRAYEMNSKIVKAADEMYSTTTNMR